MKYLVISLLALGSINAAAAVGQAGCGLGNQILGNEPGFMQVVAATSNGFSGSQTFGITSGTSNCLDSRGNAAVEAFVEANQVALNNDISRGSGETVSTLSNMLSCANGNVAAKALQTSFDEISSQKSAPAMTESIKRTLRSAPQAGCALI